MARTKQQARKRKQKRENKTSNGEGTDPKEPPKSRTDEPKSKKPYVEDEKALRPNTKGFLISFRVDGEDGYWKIVKSALQLLNEYADKGYRTDEKSCYFEHKLSNNPGQSPIFIETDMDDPIVLLDAIITDLQTPNFDVEKVKLWSSFLPVNRTCNIQPDEIIQSIKTVLDPVFAELDDTKIPRVNMNYRRFRVPDSDKDAVASEIKTYLTSKGAETGPTTEGVVENYADMSVDVRVFRKVCCISFMDGSRSNRYSIVNTLNQRAKVLEEACESHQAENEEEQGTGKADTAVKKEEEQGTEQADTAVKEEEEQGAEKADTAVKEEEEQGTGKADTAVKEEEEQGRGKADTAVESNESL